MNIYDTLIKDHQKLSGLLDQLVACSESNSGEWKNLIDQIRDELVPHSRAEEAVFYNALRENDPDNGVVAHSYIEHTLAEAELRTLQAMKAIDVNWTRLAKKLRDDILHHVEEEQGKVFAAAKKVFSEEEAEMIGRAFTQLKPSIKEQSLAGTSLDLVANLLPQRLANTFRKSFGTPTAAGAHRSL